MPNTEVKLLSVDGSQNLRSARVERCQASWDRKGLFLCLKRQNKS